MQWLALLTAFSAIPSPLKPGIMPPLMRLSWERAAFSRLYAAVGMCLAFLLLEMRTCREVQALLGEQVITAPVKKGLGRFSARTLSHADACALIQQRVTEALSNRAAWPKPWKPEPPVTFRVELATPDKASAFLGRTGVEIVGPRTVISRGENFWQAWDQFWYRS